MLAAYIIVGIAYLATTAKIDKSLDVLYIGKGTK
jgi:hypothetical protein